MLKHYSFILLNLHPPDFNANVCVSNVYSYSDYVSTSVALQLELKQCI